MVDILEDDGPTLSPLSVGAVLLTAALCAGIAWNALMNQPRVPDEEPLPRPAAALSVHPEKPPGGTITLRFDPVIEEVQKALAASHYYSGPIDGVAGKRTRMAIESFQSANGLDVTGQATAELAERIRFTNQIAEAAGVSAITPGSAPDDRILKAQRELAELGYAPGAVDGSMGDQTHDAIRAFERDRGLPETGEISARLMEELAKTAGGTASR
jgi:peptidoglycan hydrolase-like protein with peptidoglycan-binding domain